jgi:hypothetical protein
MSWPAMLTKYHIQGIVNEYTGLLQMDVLILMTYMDVLISKQLQNWITTP